MFVNRIIIHCASVARDTDNNFFIDGIYSLFIPASSTTPASSSWRAHQVAWINMPNTQQLYIWYIYGVRFKVYSNCKENNQKYTIQEFVWLLICATAQPTINSPGRSSVTRRGAGLFARCGMVSARCTRPRCWCCPLSCTHQNTLFPNPARNNTGANCSTAGPTSSNVRYVRSSSTSAGLIRLLLNVLHGGIHRLQLCVARSGIG